jgi:hypothetical protein
VLRRSAITLVIWTALLAAGAVQAQGRGPDVQQLRTEARARAAIEAEKRVDPDVRAAKLAELDAFMRQLVGRFRFDGNVRVLSATSHSCIEGSTCFVTHNAQGVGDCAGFGNGPGVQCIIHVPWPRFFRPLMGDDEINWPGPYLDTAMILYGIDPGELAVRFQIVDGQSRAYTNLGTLKDNILTFEKRWSCAYAECRRIFQVRIRPDRNYLEMQYETWEGVLQFGRYQFTLHREPEPSPDRE